MSGVVGGKPGLLYSLDGLNPTEKIMTENEDEEMKMFAIEVPDEQCQMCLGIPEPFADRPYPVCFTHILRITHFLEQIGGNPAIRYEEVSE